jgi:hypothetical protein
VQVLDQDQNPLDEDGGTFAHPLVVGTTHTWSNVHEGGYELLSITPWSGLDCYGISPCSISSEVVVTATASVTADSTTTFTAHVTLPTITGSSAAGSPLSIQIPQGLTRCTTFVPTKTKTKLPRNIRAGDRVSLKVKVKATGGTPDGEVTIKVGRSTVRKVLETGSTFLNLPRLDAGRYKIKVKYAGTPYFAASKDSLKITVHPK